MKKIFEIICLILILIFILTSCNSNTSQINDEDIILPKLTEQEKNDIDSKDIISYNGELYINLFYSLYKIDNNTLILIYKDFQALKEIGGEFYGIKTGKNSYIDFTVNYSDMHDGIFINDSFAKIKPDGSEYEELAKINGGYHDYYYNESESKFYINYIKLDTTDIEIFLFEYDLNANEKKEKENVMIPRYDLTYYENYIYYDVNNDNYAHDLYRVDYDGNVQLLCDDLQWNNEIEDAPNIIIKNDMIYYISDYRGETAYNYSLNKMKTDGTDRQIVAKLKDCNKFQSYGDWLYIWGYDWDNHSTPCYIEKINFATGQKEAVNVPTDNIACSFIGYGYFYQKKYVEKISPHGEVDFKKLYFYNIENKKSDVLKFKNDIYDEILYNGYKYIVIEIPDEPVKKNQHTSKYKYEVYKVKIGSTNIVKMETVK